jgi:DNA repair protein RAD5
MRKANPKSKCVVFSQYEGVLDVASEELLGRGIAFARIDGNSKQYERADALLEFSSNPDTTVFLLTMRAGAVGLTLTSADHCFILDIAQNSAIEEQAIDR